MKNLLKFTVIFILSLIVVSEVSAQTGFGTNLGNYPGVLSVTNIVTLFSRLVCYIIRYAIIATMVALIIYGIMFLKSRGNAQEFGGAKKALAWGLVGTAVIFGVFTIILSVASVIGVSYPITTYIQC